MAQFCNCARLVLSHTLLFVFGKALLRFFEVGDCVIVFESVEEDSKAFLDSETMGLDSESELLNLESKLVLDSEFSLNSAFGLPGHSKI